MATFRWWTFGTEVVLFELYIPPITPKHQINLSTGCNEYAKPGEQWLKTTPMC